MFTIIPYGRGRLPSDDDRDTADLLASIVPTKEVCDPAQRPFVELSHQEIPKEDVEAVLGYAGMTKANAPVGLPGDFERRLVARDCLLLPLSGLEAHFRRTDAAVIAEYERHSTIEQFLGARDMSGRDYLVAGLLECIKWRCKHRRL